MPKGFEVEQHSRQVIVRWGGLRAGRFEATDTHLRMERRFDATIEVPADDVQAVDCVERSDRRGQPAWDLVIQVRRSKPIKLLSGLAAPDAPLFLEREIKRVLRLSRPDPEAVKAAWGELLPGK